MKQVITWAVRNGAGMNFLVLAVLIVGFSAFFLLRRETFPEFQLEVILVSVPYPGATPDEVESGICQKIEEAVRPLVGIKKLTSICREGGGYTLAQLETSVEPQKVLSEIRSAVDRISVFFPERSEKSTVEQITFRLPAINVAVIGPPNAGDQSAAELALRDQAEKVRERLLELPSVSQVTIVNAKAYQIDVEIEESTLREYGLTLSQIANIIRRENIELPSGQLKTDGQEILLRGKNKREIGTEIGQLPLVTKPNGVVLTVNDLGHVRDDFVDITSISRVNGEPAMVMKIERTSNEDLLNIAEEVHDFVQSTVMPSGFRLQAFSDQSVDVRDRMRMLRDNGIQGVLVVFLLLAVFLNLRLGFWVALGIPIALGGAAIVLYFNGDTLNMLTMFAFLMAVGIVVDDGIVIGENIYAHRLRGKSNFQAAIDGATEVLPSVYSSVATTIIAFMPLFFVSGVMGKFIAVMPVAIIAMLLVSLVEASFALPGHLAHEAHAPRTLWQRIVYGFNQLITPFDRVFAWLSVYANAGLDRFGERLYTPILRISFQYPQIPLAAGVLVVAIAIGMVRSGKVPFEFFPDLDGKVMIGQVTYPDGTPMTITRQATEKLEAAALRISRRIADEEDRLGTNRTPEPNEPNAPRGPVKLTFMQVGASKRGDGANNDQTNGSHVGQVEVELHDSLFRTVTRAELIGMWRDEAGELNAWPSNRKMSALVESPSSSKF
jgi:hydrophobic/amphiphilic exporter-1 (mainly G- bacteria), HAE1 family